MSALKQFRHLGESPGNSRIYHNLPVLCMCCRKRIPYFVCIDHMLHHMTNGKLISCPECPALLENRNDIMSHIGCFIEEGKRSQAPCKFVCHCGYCASNDLQLSGHNIVHSPRSTQSPTRNTMPTIPRRFSPPNPTKHPQAFASSRFTPVSNANEPRSPLINQVPRTPPSSSIDRDGKNSRKYLELGDRPIQTSTKRQSDDQSNGHDVEKRPKFTSQVQLPEMKNEFISQSSAISKPITSNVMVQTEIPANMVKKDIAVGTKAQDILGQSNSLGTQTDPVEDDQVCVKCDGATCGKVKKVLEVVDKLSKCVDLMQQALADVRAYMTDKE